MRHLGTKFVAIATGLLCSLAAANGAEGTAPFDADNIGEATAMVAVEAQVIELSRRWCNEQFPELKRRVDYAALKWRDRNTTELHALLGAGMLDSSLAKTAAATGFVAVKALDAEKQKAYCYGFAVAVPEGIRDVRVRTPQASRYLTEYLRDKPLTEQQARGFEFESGCVKRGFEKEQGLDELLRQCQCLWRAMDSLSPQEWREYAAAASAKQDVTQLPQIKRVTPQIAACVKP